MDSPKIILLVAAGALLLVALTTPHPDTRSAPNRTRPATQWNGLPEWAQNPKAASQEVETLARRTGGDYSKLTPEEQRWLDGMSVGHGEVILIRKAQELSGRPGERKILLGPPVPVHPSRPSPLSTAPLSPVRAPRTQG